MRHRISVLRTLRGFGIVIVLVSVATLSSPFASASAPLAQDDNDAIGTPTIEGYPARISTGTCDNPGAEDAFSLTDVAPRGVGDSSVYVSETEVMAPIADLLDAPHVIAILASGDDLIMTRACAELNGQVVDGKLIAPLRAPDDDELLGVAVLEEREGTTVVDIYLVLSSRDTAVDDGADEDDDNSTDDGGV